MMPKNYMNIFSIEFLQYANEACLLFPFKQI